MSKRRSSKRCHCDNSIGAQLGGMAQKGLTSLAKSWFGMGDYTLKSNSLIQLGGTTTSDLQIVPSGNREVRIIYREYIGDVFTHPTVAGQFYPSTFNINPGLVSVFPWLAPIAQQYEQWTPNGIVFEFKSTSSEYVATQALGSIIMATEYDVLDAAYADKQTMLNSAYSNEAKPSQRIVHGIECDPRDNPNRIFYVRSGSVPTGSTARDYDIGNFTIATQGGATANLNLGSLYVHYDITFRKEQLFNGIPLKGQYRWMGSTLNPTAATAFPSTPLSGSDPGVTVTNVTSAGGKINFPNWMVGMTIQIILIASNSTNTLSAATQTLVNCSLYSASPYPFIEDFSANGNPINNFIIKVIQVTGPSASYAFGGLGFVSASAVSLSIMQVRAN